MGKRTSLILAIIVVVASSWACSTHAPVAPTPPIDPTRLPHAQHTQVACVDCHRGDARPGADDHKPCDDGKCHRAQFLAAPGPLCRVCHTQVTTAPLAAPLRTFPTDDAWQTEAPRFSHQRHLDAARIEAKVGFHVGCPDCHTRADGVLARPDHATCARCHAAEVKLVGAPAMDACAGCHDAVTRPRTRGRLIRDDLHFDHTRHLADRGGHVIKCEQCHAASATATGYDDHAPPSVASCVGCHDDTDRTPPTMRMRVCETCHATRRTSLISIAPRSHLPATERPLDHTLAFRRDHGEAAERDAMRCASCHTQMSGNAHQACDECHQTMRPVDHRITWRELDHGPDASADRERCARCHVVDFCVACHTQRPRSHGLISGSFVQDHGPIARIDILPCVTCHVESFCAPCHTGGAPRKVRR